MALYALKHYKSTCWLYVLILKGKH